MFGSARQAALETRVAELEQQVRVLNGQLEAVRPLLADAGRLEALAARAEAAVRALEPQAETLAEGFDGKLDTLYRAETTGFVAVYFDTGWNAHVRLLVGPTNPPTRCVGEVRLTSDHSAYAGGVVRAGEWWIAESDSNRQDLKFHVHFTPVF